MLATRIRCETRPRRKKTTPGDAGSAIRETFISVRLMGPHTMKVAVIGLGYVGIPVAALLASKGVRSVGIDIDRRKVEAVAAGRSPLEGDEAGLEDRIA